MVINPIVGVYIPIIRIPIQGGMTIPNIATFDRGTCVLWPVFPGLQTTDFRTKKGGEMHPLCHPTWRQMNVRQPCGVVLVG